MSAIQLAEFAAVVVVLVVEYHYGWNPIALALTGLAGFVGIFGDGTRRYLSNRNASERAKANMTIATLICCVALALAAAVADRYTKHANKIPIFITGGHIISRPAANGAYLLAAKMTVQNDTDADLQVRWSAAEAFGRTSDDEINRAKDIAEVRRMGDTVSEPIEMGTLPRKILTDIATPELTVSPADYKRFISGKGTFYFSGAITAADGTWALSICGYSPGDPRSVIQCPK